MTDSRRATPRTLSYRSRMGEFSQGSSFRADSALRVLVTKDRLEVSGSLDAQLGTLGCSVRLARDGASAMRHVITFRPNLAFLDLGLPLLDAFEMARSIRLHPALAKMTLVAVTSFRDDFYPLRAAGFDRYLRKPYNLDRLAEVITSVRRRSVPPAE
jgi:DNA-binding response OmpR family regulator